MGYEQQIIDNATAIQKILSDAKRINQLTSVSVLSNNFEIAIYNPNTDKTLNTTLFDFVSFLTLSGFEFSQIKDQFNYNVVNDTEIGTVYTSPVNTKIRELGNVLKSNGFYYLTIGIAGDPYVETNVDLYLMKSADLVTWSNEGLMVSSSEDGWLVEFNGEYYLYCEDKVPNPFTGIKLYKSTDLATWSDEGYVFDKDGAGWEGTDVSSPTIWIENGTWYMFYEGRNTGTNQWGAIGLATSSDGITWVRDVGNPIISGTNINSDITWSDEIVPDDIFKIGDIFYLTIHGYSAGGWRFGILTSNNLTDWTPLKDTYFDDSAIVSSNMVVYNSENKGFLTFMVNPIGATPFRELVIGRFGIDYTIDIDTFEKLDAIVADKSLVNLEDVNTFTSVNRFPALLIGTDFPSLPDYVSISDTDIAFFDTTNNKSTTITPSSNPTVNIDLTLPDASGTIALTSDITGGGDVSKSGTPVGGQVTVWMSDGTVLGKDTFYFNDDSSSAILTVGDSGVKRGNLIIEADPTGSTAGGEINLIIADDYDTSITKYILKAQSDDFVIRDSSSEILRHDYSVSKWKFSQYGDGTKTGTASYSLAVDSSGNIIEEPLIIVSAPATSTSTGIAGQIAYDSSYFYVCTATNTWVRTALATW